MERTKKQEKVILIHFLIFLLLLIGVVISFFMLVFPWIKEVESMKTSVHNTYETISQVQKKWISYDEFKSLISGGSVWSVDWKDASYTTEIVNSVSTQFYAENLVNNTESTYDAFLEKKSNEDFEVTELQEKKEAIVSQVLPQYSEFVSDFWDWSLSDFRFVNYIESIIETFNLEYENQIWISEAILVSDYAVLDSDNITETNIYYIPQSLNISWRRSDVLDFLHYISNVGKIVVDWEGIAIDTTIDTDFRNSFRSKTLIWQDPENFIFNNQVIDIENVYFSEFIDPEIGATKKYNESSSLVSYIKGSNFEQDKEGYKAELKLNFYVKWLPIYKITEYIRWFVIEFNSLQTNLDTTLANAGLNSVDRQKLTEIKTVLWQMSTWLIPEIQKWMNSQEALNRTYINVNNYYNTINDYKNTLDQINKSLWSTLM